jgi:hypothetical protein
MVELGLPASDVKALKRLSGAHEELNHEGHNIYFIALTNRNNDIIKGVDI